MRINVRSIAGALSLSMTSAAVVKFDYGQPAKRKRVMMSPTDIMRVGRRNNRYADRLC